MKGVLRAFTSITYRLVNEVQTPIVEGMAPPMPVAVYDRDRKFGLIVPNPVHAPPLTVMDSMDTELPKLGTSPPRPPLE